MFSRVKTFVLLTICGSSLVLAESPGEYAKRGQDEKANLLKAVTRELAMAKRNLPQVQRRGGADAKQQGKDVKTLEAMVTRLNGKSFKYRAPFPNHDPKIGDLGLIPGKVEPIGDADGKQVGECVWRREFKVKKCVYLEDRALLLRENWGIGLDPKWLVIQEIPFDEKQAAALVKAGTTPEKLKAEGFRADGVGINNGFPDSVIEKRWAVMTRGAPSPTTLYRVSEIRDYGGKQAVVLEAEEPLPVTKKSQPVAKTPAKR